MAKVISQAVGSRSIDGATAAAICGQPDVSAMMRNMQLQDCAALLRHLRKLADKPAMVQTASLVSSELSQPNGGRYGRLEADVALQAQPYVPVQFRADIKVHFIFGGYSNGFSYDDRPDDIYVDLAFFADATIEELAETVTHEVFHAVQNHVMKTDVLPVESAVADQSGRLWLNHLLRNLEQEGTAEIFTHPLALRPATSFSAKRREAIQHNAAHIDKLMTLLETIGWRMLYVPPADENEYDRVAGIMFYREFDETAYDVGWLMASTIAKRDGNMAIFALLKEDPKQFLLRYQAIAAADGKLPKFSTAFVERVKAL